MRVERERGGVATESSLPLSLLLALISTAERIHSDIQGEPQLNVIQGIVTLLSAVSTRQCHASRSVRIENPFTHLREDKRKVSLMQLGILWFSSSADCADTRPGVAYEDRHRISSNRRTEKNSGKLPCILLKRGRSVS